MTKTLVFALLYLLAAIGPANAGPMTPGERQRLIAHLQMTEAWLVSELQGLSEAQLRFKITPESWSITEVVEHLAIAEPQYWKNLEDSLKAPVQPGYKAEATDAAILWYGIDRTNRTTTGEARVPKGAYPGAAASLAAFRKLRTTMLETARTSQDDFRGRPLTGGNQDVYQWFLMISTHAQRHILQIREIKTNAGYPQR
jgi:DinB superfamily